MELLSEATVRHTMDTFIPQKMTSSRFNLPWFNRSLRRQARAKQRLYNKTKASVWKPIPLGKILCRSETYASEFKINKEHTYFWFSWGSNWNKSQTALVIHLINNLKKHDPGVADFEFNGSVISDGNRKAEILNEHFSRVFTKEDLLNIPNVGNDPRPKISLLGSLKPCKACGPDAIPPWFLKEYATELALRPS